MRLSVIIVNYNVRAYLEQCLRTVLTALEGMEGEVFVVDNQSTDGSVEMVRGKFPGVRLIANRENVGFSRANNQAIRISGGKYVLLLNPDTVVGEDVFRKVVAFLDARPNVGGAGVKMIDGTGRFLPESKRGLPTPRVAFFKIIGLTRLFPRSRVFGRYHLGHLPENEAAPIEILSGACMFLRRSTLERVGLLDESFFMYGEDIDLSYRITMGGFENWYLPEARIVHYKGESTKKSSVNYVFVFYNAMAIFAQKHFTSRSAGVFPLLINGSIYLSAAGAIAVRFLNRALLPILDLLAVALVLALSRVVPARWPVVQELGMDLVIGLGVVVWTALLGAYDRPTRPLAPVAGLALLLVVGGAVGMAMGTSMGDVQEVAPLVVWTALATVAVRVVLHLFRVKGHGLRRKERERVLAVGSPHEAQRTLALLWQTHYGLGWTGVLGPAEAVPGELAALVRRKRVGEVVFCAQDMPWGAIIGHMEELRRCRAELKIAQPDQGPIIGPSSIEGLQDLHVLENHAVNGAAARRGKRVLDVAVALLLLVGLPVAAWFVPSPRALVRNACAVLGGRMSWVGYQRPMPKGLRLPAIAPGVIGPMVRGEDVDDALTVARVNTIYAKDYSLLNDLRLLLRGFRALGRV